MAAPKIFYHQTLVLAGFAKDKIRIKRLSPDEYSSYAIAFIVSLYPFYLLTSGLFFQHSVVKLRSIRQIAIEIHLLVRCLHGHVVIGFRLRGNVFIEGMIDP